MTPVQVADAIRDAILASPLDRSSRGPRRRIHAAGPLNGQPDMYDGETFTINGKIFEFDSDGVRLGCHARPRDVCRHERQSTRRAKLVTAMTNAGIGVTPVPPA